MKIEKIAVPEKLTFSGICGIVWLTESMGANVFCFLSSLPLLPPATTAVFGSYLSSSAVN